MRSVEGHEFGGGNIRLMPALLRISQFPVTVLTLGFTVKRKTGSFENIEITIQIPYPASKNFSQL